MDAWHKKKYRIESDMCYTYGFDKSFFDGGFGPEQFYGLYLNSRRLRNSVGGNVFQAMVNKDCGYVNYDMMDSMADDEDDIPKLVSEIKLMMKDIGK